MGALFRVRSIPFRIRCDDCGRGREGEAVVLSPKECDWHTDESTEIGLDFSHGFVLAQLKRCTNPEEVTA